MIAVCFLLHFPWPCGPQYFTGISSCEVRTFLLFNRGDCFAFPKFLCASHTAAAALRSYRRAFERFAFLPVVDARAVLTKDQVFAFAH